jgi:hypothetical protein
MERQWSYPQADALSRLVIFERNYQPSRSGWVMGQNSFCSTRPARCDRVSSSLLSYMFCRKASCAFVTSDSLRIAGAQTALHCTGSCLAVHRNRHAIGYSRKLAALPTLPRGYAPTARLSSGELCFLARTLSSRAFPGFARVTRSELWRVRPDAWAGPYSGFVGGLADLAGPDNN